MGRRRDALSSLTGGGEGDKQSAEEIARDIDWIKIRRVQHGLSRPHERQATLSPGYLSPEEMEIAEARSRKALRLAHLLAFLAGILLGFAFLRGLADEFRLLCAAAVLASTAALLAERSYAWWSIGTSCDE